MRDIRALREELLGRINEVDQKAEKHRDELLAEIKRVDQKVDNYREELLAEIRRMDRKIDSHFRWTIGILIAGMFSIITIILTIWLKF
jgi:sRNA-binding carbon storage regulator CsrA